MSVAAIHVKNKKQNKSFHRTVNRPKAALSDRHEIRVIKKKKKNHPSVLGSFFSTTAHQTLKFSANFRKRKKPIAES